jgi:dipeptidyl aminopeptidase/acylaminoacyl peptidase
MANLKARSPISHAATIKGKVLLMHQQGDALSPEEQSNAMRRALKAADNAPTWETISQNYSSYFTPQARADIYTRILSFANRQIGKEK